MSQESVTDPMALFQRLAHASGLLQPGEPLSPELVAFAQGVASECAAIGDQYGGTDDNAGDHIRAVMFE